MSGAKRGRPFSIFPDRPITKKEKDSRYYYKNREKLLKQKVDYRKQKADQIKENWRNSYWKKYRPHRLQYLTTRIAFKNKRPIVKFNPRIGVCNLCRAVVGIDCKITHMHHEQYDPENPLKHTIELCVSCHKKKA
jgi:hypothetical protein